MPGNVFRRCHAIFPPEASVKVTGVRKAAGKRDFGQPFSMKSGKFLRGFLKPESHEIPDRRRGEDGIEQTQTGAWADAGAFCYFLQSDGGIVVFLDENQRLFDAKLVPLVLTINAAKATFDTYWNRKIHSPYRQDGSSYARTPGLSRNGHGEDNPSFHKRPVPMRFQTIAGSPSAMGWKESGADRAGEDCQEQALHRLSTQGLCSAI